MTGEASRGGSEGLGAFPSADSIGGIVGTSAPGFAFRPERRLRLERIREPVALPVREQERHAPEPDFKLFTR